MSELWVCHLGTVDYREALALQERVRAARQRDQVPDVMLLLEHWPVYTRGRRSAPGELPMGEEWYRMQGIEVIETDRGGKVTYHGPGQLVGYPIVRVDDVVAYVRTLEQSIVAALAQEGIPDARARFDDGPDFTGVWVQRAQARVDRGSRPTWRDDPRVRGQRRERSPAVRLGRALRPRGCPDDEPDQGDRPSRGPDAVLPATDGLPGGRGARAPTAADEPRPAPAGDRRRAAGGRRRCLTQPAAQEPGSRFGRRGVSPTLSRHTVTRRRRDVGCGSGSLARGTSAGRWRHG